MDGGVKIADAGKNALMDADEKTGREVDLYFSEGYRGEEHVEHSLALTVNIVPFIVAIPAGAMIQPKLVLTTWGIFIVTNRRSQR